MSKLCYISSLHACRRDAQLVDIDRGRRRYGQQMQAPVADEAEILRGGDGEASREEGRPGDVVAGKRLGPTAQQPRHLRRPTARTRGHPSDSPVSLVTLSRGSGERGQRRRSIWRDARASSWPLADTFCGRLAAQELNRTEVAARSISRHAL